MKLKFKESSEPLKLGDVIIGDETWHICDKGRDNALSIEQKLGHLREKKQDDKSAKLVGKIFLVTDAKMDGGFRDINDEWSDAWHVSLKELNQRTFEIKRTGLSLDFYQRSCFIPDVTTTKIVGHKPPRPPAEPSFEKFEPVV
jgi:hypothetical protein